MSFRTTIAVALLGAALAANVHDRSYYEAKFHDWMVEHKIKIESGERFVQMIQNFANNDDLIEAHNAKKESYTMGHNKFSGMSNEEFAAFVAKSGLKRPKVSTAKFVHKAPSDVSTLPASVDWRDSGKVAAVKDQGQCGSCWSFSTVCALEGAYAIKYGTLTTFSEQYFVSCDNRKNGGTDMGCNGGLMDSAFEWAETNGVCTEASYPYVSGDSKEDEDCLSTGVKVSGAAPKSYTDVTPQSDSAMMSAVAQQPVAIAIQANQIGFQLYKSGVFTGKCGDSLDHGVATVGYGTEDGQDYYLVRNSWGDSWGEDGYIKLERGGSQKNGQCGMLSEPSYPNL
jgi:C1A family cysteine protease